MDRKFNLLSLLCCIILAAGCAKGVDEELYALDARLVALEERCSSMNADINALHAIVGSYDRYDFVTDVSPVYDADGSIRAYRISFSNSGTVTVSSGRNAGTPVIGVEKDVDGQYYWTVTHEDGTVGPIYINNTSQKVSASAIRPAIRIEDGNWMISYDGGVEWSYLGKATGTAGVSFVDHLDVSDSVVCFHFIDGSTVNVPTLSTFEKYRSAAELINENTKSLQQLIDLLYRKLYVTDLRSISDGYKPIGCRMYFSDGTNIAFYDAQSTVLPQIGAAMDESIPGDDNYYWTISFPGQRKAEWLECGGEKVRMNVAASAAPQIGLQRSAEDNLYYWTVSYDGGSTWEWLLDGTAKVRASALPAENPVTCISATSSLFYTLTVNGMQITVPRCQDLGVDIPTEVSMHACDTCSLQYFISNSDENTALLPIVADEGFNAWIERYNYTRGRLVITSPETFTSGSSTVSLLVSDGKGVINTIVINVKFKEASL